MTGVAEWREWLMAVLKCVYTKSILEYTNKTEKSDSTHSSQYHKLRFCFTLLNCMAASRFMLMGQRHKST